MIKAVIFDFFGVLAVRGTTSFRKTFFPNDAARMEQASTLQKQLGLGKIGYDDYIEGLAKLGKTSRDTVLKYTEDYQANSELLDYIQNKLKTRHKIGIISNAGDDWVLKILGQDYYKLFDDVVLSYKVGLIKPEAQIYEMSAANLGVKQNECVFIDDILTYCQGAEAVGMNTIWYQSFEQMKIELEKLVGSDS